MPFIAFITGSSASGKTTLYESLRKDSDLNDIYFHDIDEDGIPPVGRGPWREYRVEQLLFDAVNAAKTGHSTIICGNTFPHEVLESRYYDPTLQIHLIALRTTDVKLRQRILERLDKNKQSGNFDECFGADNIEKTILENITNQRIISNATSALKRGHVIDTAIFDQLEMHDQVKQLILTFNTGGGD